MKRFKLLAFVLLVGSVIIFSCTKDKNTTPTITFKGGTGYTSTNVTLAPGTVFTVGIIAAQGPDGTKLVKFTVTRNFSVGPDLQTAVDSTISGDINWNGTFAARGAAGTEKWTFTVTDKDGNTANVSFTITTQTTVSYGAIHKYPASGTITLGAQSNSNPSFLASSTGNTYGSSTVLANISLVDLCYGSLVSGDGSLISPSDWNTEGFSPTLTGATITHFGPSSISTTTFDALNNDSLIKDIPTTMTVVYYNITQGNVYQFVNANGKKGLVKVVSQVTGAAGSASVVVKVQQ